jgi:hypothetical protein
MRHDFPTTTLPALGIRPFFRIAGALFFAALAASFLLESSRIWSAVAVVTKNCDAERRLGVLICNATNWLLEVLPASLQGPLSAMAGTFAGIVLIGLAWLLLRPLVARRPKS